MAGIGDTIWQVERSEFCRKRLAWHWPQVERFEDVRKVGKTNLSSVDLLCGGFPCTDISDASRGRGEGIEGSQTGLWREFIRIGDELRPEWIVAENVAGAAGSVWVPVLRRALHGIGYASLPIRVRASDVGAPFAGARIFIAAAHRESESARALHVEMAELRELAAACRKDWGLPPPGALGLADGIPGWVEHNRALGNAVVPATAELIGRLILKIEESNR